MTEKQAIELHVAGATVRHKSPFGKLICPTNDGPMTQELIDEWVQPFYMMPLQHSTSEFVAACARVSPEIILELLRHFNWRPRVVAAHFIAVRREFDIQSELSTLFLKSEVCDAGRGYCLALARFNNQAAAQTLCEYLEYYLTRTDLWFDQNEAMAALIYLDEQQGSDLAVQFALPYQRFIANKPNWDLPQSCRWPREDIAHIEEIEKYVRDRE